MPEAAIRRLFSHRLEHSPFQTPADAVTWLVALQGQDYAGAKWSLGLRVPGATDATVEQAIADRAIIRTWALRGTLHLLAAQDVRWVVALVAPRLIAGNTRRYRELELDEPTLTRSNNLLAKALEGGQPCTRTELFEMLEANGISTQGQRGVYMLQRASLDGLICQGITIRNEPTFIALDKSVAAGEFLTGDEALAALAQRYFTSRAPATLEDFVWWSGLPITQARRGLEAVQAQLTRENVEGQTYWLPADSLEQVPTPAAPLHLLPGFDEYLISYRDRTASLDKAYATAVVPGGNGVFFPTIVSHGRVVGTWKRTFKKGAAVITPTPFTSLTPDEMDAFTDAARGFGAFLGMPVTVA